MPLVLSLDAYAAVACQVLVNEELNYIKDLLFIMKWREIFTEGQMKAWLPPP